MNLSQRATLVGSVAIFLWGSSALLVKLTEGFIPTFQLMAMSYTLAFLVSLVKWSYKKENGIKYLRQPIHAWLVSIIGFSGFHFCYFLAMNKAPAANVSLLIYLWPLLLVIFSTFLPGERMKPRHILGGILAFGGSCILLSNGIITANNKIFYGYILAVIGALIWTVYSLFTRLTKSVPSDAVGWFCAASAMLSIVIHLQFEKTVWPQTLLQWVGVFGLGIGPVGIAFFTWDYGTKRGDIQLLGVLAYSAPLISVTLLILAGEAKFNIELFVACVLIIGGSIVAGNGFSNLIRKFD